MKLQYLTIWILSMLATTAFAQDNTIGTIVYNEDATDAGFNLIYPHNQPDAFLLDMCGNVVHKWENADSLRPANVIYILENSDVMTTYRPASFQNDAIWAGGGGATIERRTWDNEPIWSFTRNDAEYRLHHDIQPMANGNVLVIAWEQRDSLECIEAGRNPENLTGAGMWSEVVWVIAPGDDGLGEVVWEWAVWDHLVQDFDATKENYGVIADNIDKIDINFGSVSNAVADWLHINAIDFDEFSQHIMLSVPTFNEIWVVDYGNTTPGELKWRWGNPMAYDRGDSTDMKLGYQHHTHWLDLALSTNSPDYGKVGVFNNRVQGDTSEYSTVHTLLPIYDEYENENTDATLKVLVGGDIEHTASDGDGPVDALNKALRKALSKFFPELEDVRLTDYKVRVLNEQEGTSAKVRVLIESAYGDESWSTIGVSKNIIEASRQALSDSFNFRLASLSNWKKVNNEEIQLFK